MRNQKVQICVFLLLGLGLTRLQAQETTNATGGNALGNGGSVCYSIGQVVWTFIAGDNFTVTQGVQQPYEIYILAGIKELGGNMIHCTVYPNPTNDFLVLKFDGALQTHYSGSIYDFNGKLLRTIRIFSEQTLIPMKNLPQATYFLKVTSEKAEIQSFKIIKN